MCDFKENKLKITLIISSPNSYIGFHDHLDKSELKAVVFNLNKI